MNEMDVEDAAQRWRGHPILGPATQTLNNLVEVVNRTSDGWPYWQAPRRAAKKLMEMIERDGTYQYRTREREDVSVEEYRKALIPLKSFRTRTGRQFEIVEASDGA